MTMMLLEATTLTLGLAVLSVSAVLMTTETQLMPPTPSTAASETMADRRTDSAPSAKLAPCPDSPNCVSTLATDERHAIEPIVYTGTAEAAKARILSIVKDMPRTKLEADDGNYLHFTFRSLIFRFVDDVEFVIDDSTKQIHFRSAARLGYGDMGINRRRMGTIRDRFSAGH